MNSQLRKSLMTVGLLLGLGCLIVGFSAFHARRICNRIITLEVAPPPHLSTRLVMRPGNHLENANDLGLKPGWVVTYAPSGKTYGTAFYVNVFGKIMARGTPSVVTKQLEQDQKLLDSFRQAFSQVDAAVLVGSAYTNALELLGKPAGVETNNNGLITAYFIYSPEALDAVAIDWLTNGITLLVSNGTIVTKGYSYMSSSP